MTAELEARLREAALHIRKLPSASMTGTTVALGVADGARIYHALTDAADALAASERDAGRYRWVRDRWHSLCTATGVDARGNYGVTEIFVGVGEDSPYADGTLDTAIDAAIAQEAEREAASAATRC